MTRSAHIANAGTPAATKGLVGSYERLLRPEPARVVLRPFVPAEDGSAGVASGQSRVELILNRVLALSEAEIDKELKEVLESLAGRHRGVEQVLQRRFYEMADRYVCGRAVSSSQTLLVGSYFAEEYSFEAAALFNPSVVAHPDQSGLAPGSIRILISLRGIGEGHISSISFRTGTFDPGGRLKIDAPSKWAISPQIEYLSGNAPDDPNLRLYCGEHDDLSQIVIFPVTYRQRHGIEDLRLVHFKDDDGQSSYLGTYTAFSGEAIRQELLSTDDFKTFELKAMRGLLSATKGMALFPRRIDGHYAMLGRYDHENIWLLKSTDLYEWNRGEIIASPLYPWEFVQIGSCSPPIEIEEGWLLITHGVGPIRSYCLGACLLDKREPSKVIARTRHPLLRPCLEMRDGYVPNVVYSCGAMVLGRTLLLPYGVADNFTAFATMGLDHLLQSMTS